MLKRGCVSTVGFKLASAAHQIALDGSRKKENANRCKKLTKFILLYRFD